MYHTLDGRDPVLEEDLEKWAKWFGTANRTVKKTLVGTHLVSTVFLGLNHDFRENAPSILFETLIFDGREDKMWRYETWDEAEEGHKKAVVIAILYYIPVMLGQLWNEGTIPFEDIFNSIKQLFT